MCALSDPNRAIARHNLRGAEDLCALADLGREVARLLSEAQSVSDYVSDEDAEAIANALIGPPIDSHVSRAYQEKRNG